MDLDPNSVQTMKVEFVFEHGRRTVAAEIRSGVFEAVLEAADAGLEDDLAPSGPTIFPGFIDVHCHGAVGVDVNTATAEDLLRVSRFLAASGVTAWLPTIVPDSDENYRRIIGEIDRLMELQQVVPAAQALGVHYEGNFANEAMCGALRPDYFKRFSGKELAALPVPASGVRMMTFAPEIAGGIELAEALVEGEWVASIGHTRADAETLERAFEAGARHITHFFNAMTGIHHRDLGVAGWGLSRAGVSFDIIADGIHVRPEMLNVACRGKLPDAVSIISDSVAPTGLGDGEFELWGETVTVESGRTRNARGSIAGSVSTMHDGFRLLKKLGFTDTELMAMTSLNPARLLGVEDSHGSIKAGRRADLVAIGSDSVIEYVMIGGKIVPPYSAD